MENIITPKRVRSIIPRHLLRFVFSKLLSKGFFRLIFCQNWLKTFAIETSSYSTFIDFVPKNKTSGC